MANSEKEASCDHSSGRLAAGAQVGFGLAGLSENELHDFFENASVGLHWVGPDGIVLRVNRAELELLGYSPDEYIGHHISEFHADQKVIDDILDRLNRGETLHSYEARLRCKDGSIRHVLISSNVYTKDGQFVHTRCFTRDITDRKRFEQRLVTEHAVTAVLAELRPLSEATSRILEAICQTTGWEWAAMWTVEQAEGVMRCADVWHRPETLVPQFEQLSRSMTFTFGIGLPGRVWASGQPAWIADVSLDNNFPRRVVAVQAGLHGALAFPVLLGTQVLGVMEFFSTEVRKPDEAVAEMMRAVGSQIGQYLDRRRADQALRQSEARNAAVLQAALDCLVSMDHQGKVIEWNPAAEKTFGYTRAEAVGQEMAELIIPPSLRERHRNGLARYLATGEGPVLGRRLEITAVRKDGTEFPVELAITRIPFDGPPTFTGHLRDITERKQSEEERNRLFVEAENANRMKDEFLSTLSHEIRTPINAILGWSQLLRSGDMNEQDKEQGLQVIERNARAQTQIVEDLLDMSRIISGKVRLDVQRVDLRSVIEQALDSILPAAEAKGLRIQKVLDPLAGPVRGDPSRLQQVVWNLLSNAVKFTPKNGRVQVALERVNSHVEIVVSDTGQGIKPEFLPHVFERFRQADPSTTRRHGGLGLGLSIVKQLVELHGGSVRAKSAGEGQGSTFVVALPFLIVETPEHGGRREHPKTFNVPAGDCGGVSLKGVKVLIVDDEQDARDLVRYVLQKCDAVVLDAASAAEAIELVKKENPQVILSDIGMPGQDGYELIRKLRQQGVTTPAAALTAFARSEDRSRAMLAGYQTHVAKPVEPTELIAVVASLSGRTGGEPK